MDFFDRYSQLCDQNGLIPGSEQAAIQFKTTRATISSWKKNKTIPRGDTLNLIADFFNVSVDYLLGRTDDTGATTAQSAASKKSAPAASARTTTPRILSLYDQLDLLDQVRVEAYVEGLLTADKYRLQQAKKLG